MRWTKKTTGIFIVWMIAVVLTTTELIVPVFGRFMNNFNFIFGLLSGLITWSIFDNKRKEEEARKGQIVGYKTMDGGIYLPSDVTIVRESKT